MHISFFAFATSVFADQITLFAVTGASRGYAFVEYETDREMRRAYEVSAI